MKEFDFEFQPPVQAGRTVFRVENFGRRDHQAVLIEVPPEVPPISEQLKGDERRTVTVISSIAARPPGGFTSFAVDLGPGRYALACFVPDADGIQHYRKGMAREFRIR